VENIRATYRNGIGKSGNVKADQLALLATRPLGVKGVTNPIRASGGADKDSRDQSRRNAPLAVMALDRLVATQDYADFARTFAGIGKAHAVRLSDHVRQVVHVTIAGVDDVPIDADSDLFRNLRKALRNFGDPAVHLVLGVRRLKALIVSADVVVLPDYEWESVEPKIRARLLEEFGFDRRSLGQPVFSSEVISAIQAVRGVAYVDLNVLDSLTDVELLDTTSLQKKLDKWSKAPTPEPYVSADLATVAKGTTGLATDIQAAELVFLTPAVPDTLILNLRGLPS
jgi:predicted phage baseplate assembly protein